MQTRNISLTCPGCGAPISVNASECPACGREIFIQTFQDAATMGIANLQKYAQCYQNMSSAGNNDKAEYSRGLCCLATAQFEEAVAAFRKTIQLNPTNPEYFFYLAIALLEGKRPYSLPLTVIKDAERQLDFAMKMGGNGIYFYLAAYIKKDFYEKKFFRTDKTSAQLLAEARQRGLPNGDIMALNQLFEKEIIL